jgi:hypothetical protein
MGSVYLESLQFKVNKRVDVFIKKSKIKYKPALPLDPSSSCCRSTAVTSLPQQQQQQQQRRAGVSFKLFDSIVKYSRSNVNVELCQAFLSKTVISSKLEASLGIDFLNIDIDRANLDLKMTLDDLPFAMLKRCSSVGASSREHAVTSSFQVNQLIVNNKYELTRLELANSRDSLRLSLAAVDAFRTTAATSEKLLETFQVQFVKSTRHVVSSCDLLNIFVNFTVLNDLHCLASKLSAAYCARLATMTTTTTTTEAASASLQNLKVTASNAYLNLVDAEQKHVYTVGTQLASVDTNFGSSFELTLQHVLVFRSTSSPREARRSSDRARSDLSNNLFDYVAVNSKSNSLLSLFQHINELKFAPNATHFVHLWGNLVNINRIKFTYANKTADLTSSKRSPSCAKSSLFIDSLFVEYSHEFVSMLVNNEDRLKSWLNLWTTTTRRNSNQRDLTNTHRSLDFKLNHANVYFLFERLYFIHFSLRELALLSSWRVSGQSRLLNVSLSEASLVQFRFEDSPPSVDTPLALNSSQFGYFKESDNLNLIFLLKSIQLNRMNECEYYVTISDALCTWSLKIHFILNEIILKHLSKLEKFLPVDDRSASSDFSLKILIESNMLVNFLFDYAQDSSKIGQLQPPPTMNYFNSNFSLIETVSIILKDVFIAYSRRDNRQFDMNISELCAFINVDDQSLLSLDNEHQQQQEEDDRKEEDEREDLRTNNNNNGEDELCTRKRKFLHLAGLSACLTRHSERFLVERKMLNAQQAVNRLLEVTVNSALVNFLFSYDFAKLFDHILNLRKCLHLMHQSTPTPTKRQPPDESLLSKDFSFNLKQLKLIIEDDPFEVKLAYNYALMADEHLESLKRRQTLEQRRVIKENNLEQHALELLCERESKIYLQRSSRVYFGKEESATGATR